MFHADPDDQERLVQLLAESARRAGTFSSAPRAAAAFEDKVMGAMALAWVARPLGMRMRMLFFRVALWLQAYWLAFRPCASTSCKQYHDELRQAFRFGRRFGRMANASQRLWSQGEIERLGIEYFDAPIMIWSRTIDFRRRRVYFGHWDWIVGVLSMYQVCFFVFLVISICLCPCFGPHEKAIYALIYGAITIFLFKLHKGSSFDVYVIGSRYFQARGLGFTPLIRNQAITPAH